MHGGTIDTNVGPCRKLLEQGHAKKKVRRDIVDPRSIKCYLLKVQAVEHGRKAMKKASVNKD